MKKGRIFFAGLCAMLLFMPCHLKGQNKEKDNKTGQIRPYAKNPFYWQFDQQPVFLIGGSEEDNLFQLPNVEEQLDLLASVGGNYVRCTMSSRDEGNLRPYSIEDGVYNLEEWNSRYWNKLKEFFRLTAERGI